MALSAASQALKFIVGFTGADTTVCGVGVDGLFVKILSQESADGILLYLT
jgi:hypothetical protein